MRRKEDRPHITAMDLLMRRWADAYEGRGPHEVHRTDVLDRLIDTKGNPIGRTTAQDIVRRDRAVEGIFGLPGGGKTTLEGALIVAINEERATQGKEKKDTQTVNWDDKIGEMHARYGTLEFDYDEQDEQTGKITQYHLTDFPGKPGDYKKPHFRIISSVGMYAPIKIALETGDEVYVAEGPAWGTDPNEDRMQSTVTWLSDDIRRDPTLASRFHSLWIVRDPRVVRRALAERSTVLMLPPEDVRLTLESNRFNKEFLNVDEYVKQHSAKFLYDKLPVEVDHRKYTLSYIRGILRQDHIEDEVLIGMLIQRRYGRMARPDRLARYANEWDKARNEFIEGMLSSTKLGVLDLVPPPVLETLNIKTMQGFQDATDLAASAAFMEHHVRNVLKLRPELAAVALNLLQPDIKFPENMRTWKVEEPARAA